MEPIQWSAKWIHMPKPAKPAMRQQPAPFFRKGFRLDGDVESAFVHVCGLGYFELYVNGRKACRDVLSPPFTAYDKTCLYCTYDIAPMLQKGENAIGAVLGNGMYFVGCRNAWDFEKAPWKDNPKLLLQAEIAYKDGRADEIHTGSGWKASAGPIVSDILYVGEEYDARLEMPGWSEPGFDDSGWAHARVCRSPGGRLAPMRMEPERIVEEFPPAAMLEVKPGVWVFDMGRNISGWARLKARGPAGTRISLEYAEQLYPDGDINAEDSSRFFDVQCDKYTLKGEGTETWEPRFTYHGFQYVRMTGFPGTPDPSSLTACHVHTDMATGGGFACSDGLVNKIQAAARAATLNNWHGLPTDCPHREKNGWTGDALMSCEQALLNFRPVNAYRKWLGDIIDCQRPSGQLPGIAPTGGWGYNWGSGPAWDSALVMIPWNIHLYTGDTEILTQCWDAIRRYIGFLDSMSEGGTVDFGLGDWCPPQPEAAGAKTPTIVSDTWFYLVDALTASQIASVLGEHEASRYYAGRAEEIRRSFLQQFVNEETGDVAGSCQTSYALALQYGIAREGVADRVFGRLVGEVERCNRHIDCGILGAKYVLQALVNGGRADLAWAMASRRDFPSWGYWMEQGATTLWETWDGSGSRNHHMFSSVSEFFYKGIAGINPDEKEPGFRRILFRPNPVPGLDWAEGWHHTRCGRARIRWERTDGGLTLDIDVPQGASAVLELPRTFKMASISGGAQAKSGSGAELQPGEYHMVASS